MQWHETQDYHKHSKTDPLPRVTIAPVGLRVIIRNREVIQDLSLMPIRRASNTFTGSMVPDPIGYSWFRAYPRLLKQGKKEPNVAGPKNGQNLTATLII
jgi:hypothetical protein